MADITGTNGPDTLFGTGFDESISVLDGDDFVNAGAGNDSVSGGLGNDDLRGLDGNDTLFLAMTTSMGKAAMTSSGCGLPSPIAHPRSRFSKQPIGIQP